MSRSATFDAAKRRVGTVALCAQGGSFKATPETSHVVLLLMLSCCELMLSCCVPIEALVAKVLPRWELSSFATRPVPRPNALPTDKREECMECAAAYLEVCATGDDSPLENFYFLR
ncbi:hypothetical protein BaRGS_00012785 [Batillaria attramentaria]|uniref:Uncharacterized protein n=1 Tax=Batillaria attramentaria TaxID=370345 RepID=A0ABD0L9L2_9CAEN